MFAWAIPALWLRRRLRVGIWTASPVVPSGDGVARDPRAEHAHGGMLSGRAANRTWVIYAAITPDGVR